MDSADAADYCHIAYRNAGSVPLHAVFPAPLVDSKWPELQMTYLTPYVVQVIMVDPVVAADGHTYERAAFQEWLLHSFMSPVDKTPLKHTRLVSNQAIKNALAIQRAQA